MRYIKIFTLFFLLLPLPCLADDNFPITSWKENINLNSKGKTAETLFQGKIRNLPQNQMMTSFSVIFDSTRNIKINKVICDNQLAEYTFVRNALTIKFPQGKGNNSSTEIYFSYEEKYDKINQFLRQEVIDIPSFAAGANANVVINFPGYFESATLNPNITKTSSNFIYNNVVPKTGVRESIKLTSANSVWDVAVLFKLTADKSLNKFSVAIPSYFQNGGQKVEDISLASSIEPSEQSTNGSKKILKFNTPKTELLIKNKARISTGKNNRLNILRNPSEYSKFSQEEAVLLSATLNQIKQNPAYKNLPLYAQIGKFVHDFIRYDISYTDKLPELKEILQNPVGVCTEFAKLYDALARVAGIPSLVINGAACGEYEKCQGHAWNTIYYNNQWIDVDPTWDLMSGVVSSSHIYFNDDKKGEISIQYFDDNKKSINSKVDFEMKNLL
jgi:hypothetical protein